MHLCGVLLARIRILRYGDEVTDTLPDAPRVPHKWYEDVLAILIGTLAVSFGIMLLKLAGGVTGGTSGIAFLLSYVTPWSFGVWFFLINLPFYALAITRMGWQFTIRTFIAVGLVSIFSELHVRFISIGHINLWYACIFGGMIMGLGCLILFRHHASLGGVNILALYLQERLGWRAGYFQLGVDGCIVIAALLLRPLPVVIASVLGAAVLNIILALNHRPYRYFG